MMILRALLGVSAALALFGTPVGVSAAEIEGVKLPETATVSGLALPLQDAKVVRRALIVRLYAVALYAVTDPSAASAGTTPRRIVVVLLRDVCGPALADTVDHLGDNIEPGAGLPRLKHYARAIADRLGGNDCSLRRGDVLSFDWVPGSGLVTRHNDRPLTAPTLDAELYTTLAAAWMGRKGR
jgi:Chalcone isomerase-like